MRLTSIVRLVTSVTSLMETKSSESQRILWIQNNRKMRSNLSSGKIATPKWASEKCRSPGHTNRRMEWCQTKWEAEVDLLWEETPIEAEWWVVSWASNNAQINNLQEKWDWWISHVLTITKNTKQSSASISSNTDSADMETPAPSHTATKMSETATKWWRWWITKWVSSQINTKIWMLECIQTCRCKCTWWPEDRCSSRATTNTCSCKWCWRTQCPTRATFQTSNCRAWWWAIKWVTKAWWD